ncbi:MAG: ABC transporter substrate-binding protein [Candidatus Adiutrix sp.]|jgi:iron complex transport system substrate-binding protein|nr:ABC transporter substrate-binding protein [Candidatus Adiutrix sp.]
MKKITSGLILILALVIISLAAPLAGAEENPRVYGATASSNFILYALDPDIVAGWITPLRDYEKKFIPEKYQNLPILGGYYGDGYIPDREVLMAQGLKEALLITDGAHTSTDITPALETLGIHTTVLSGNIPDLPQTFRSLGRIYGRPERGEALGAYAEKALAAVKAAVGDLPPAKRPTVYVAMQADGLATVCEMESLELAGGRNVHQCLAGNDSTLHITFEQLLTYDPDVILVYHPPLAKEMVTDPNWSRLRAVREGRYYLMPRGPFTWLERPTTFMRLLGLQWLANILHPDLLPLDIKAETETFMQLFFKVALTGPETDKLLKSGALSD